MDSWLQAPLENVSKVLYGTSSIAAKLGLPWWTEERIYILLLIPTTETPTEDAYVQWLIKAGVSILGETSSDALAQVLEHSKNTYGVNSVLSIRPAGTTRVTTLKAVFDLQPSRLPFYPPIGQCRCVTQLDDVVSWLLTGRYADALRALEGYAPSTFQPGSDALALHGQALTPASKPDLGSPVPLVFDHLYGPIVEAIRLHFVEGAIVYGGYEHGLRARMQLPGVFFPRNAYAENPYQAGLNPKCPSPFDVFVAPCRYPEDSASRAALIDQVMNTMISSISPRDCVINGVPTGDSNPRRARLVLGGGSVASFAFVSGSHTRHPSPKEDAFVLSTHMLTFDITGVDGHILAIMLGPHRLLNIFMFRNTFADCAPMGRDPRVASLLPIIGYLAQFVSIQRRFPHSDSLGMTACLLRAQRCIRWLMGQ